MNIENFISVDWGTSNFRMRLVEVPKLRVIEEITSSKGIKTIYNEWKETNEDRESYFLRFLQSQLTLFNEYINPSIKMIISGMGSSGIGLRELPYADIPFNTNGHSLFVDKIDSLIIPHPIYLISGVKSATDVIRGEEVQIVGLLSDKDLEQTVLFILPGTHSKHMMAQKGMVTNFKTYMTGEIFQVIQQHTILKDSIEFGELHEAELKSFEEGVLTATDGSSVLNSLFKIRTNTLFNEKTKTENFFYLSGLLIGDELKTLKTSDFDTLKLCAGGKLFDLYLKAIDILGLLSVSEVVERDIVDHSVIKGQWTTIKNNLNLN